MATILVVDDRPANREYLVTLLGYRKHRILEASDGAEALTIARAERPDLVITDILMPTMDGYEFVRQLRSDPAVAETKVMFLTATYRENEAASLARSCGVERVLTKPCEPEIMFRAVDECLGAPSRPQGPPPEEFDRDHLRVLTDKLSQTADDLRNSNQRMAALVDINLVLASERDPQQLLRNVCASARDLIGSRFAVLAVGPKDDSNDVSLFTTGMDATAIAALGRPKLREGVVGRVFADRLSRRFTFSDQQETGLPDGFPTARSFLVAPIVSTARTYGWICLVDKIGGFEFNVEDERLLGILGAQAGRIYENGSLYVEVQRHSAHLVAEIERRRSAQAALSESEERFRQMSESIRDVFFLTSVDGQRMFYVSPAYEEVWGRSCGSVYANPESWTDAIHKEDRQAAYEQYRKGMAAGRFEFECRIVRPDGSIRWIVVRGFPVLDGQGALVRIAGVARDITGRKQAEIKIRRLNRVYAVLSGINTLIVRSRDRGELFRKACEIAIDPGGFPIAWIGMVDESRTRLGLAASAGVDGALLSAVRNLFGTDGTVPVESSAAGLAITSKKPFIANDSQNDPRVRLGKRHAEFGILSMAALPLIVADEAVGVLVLGASEIDFFHDDELKLLNELAADVSFAIDHIDKQDRLNYLAYYDALTGLANAALFQDRLTQYVRAALDNEHKLALMLIDIERFKSINDSLGRQAGDSLLRQAAELLTRIAGESNVVARVSANQFAIVVPRVRIDGDVARLFERKRGEFLDHPFRLNDAAYQVAIKGGIALYPDDGVDADTLFKNAEGALKKAKASGEAYRFYDKTMAEGRAEPLRPRRDEKTSEP